MGRLFQLGALFSLAALVCTGDSRNQTFEDFVSPMPAEPGDVLAIGIVGGWERWDNPVRCIRRTAIALKERRLPGVHVETVENHKLGLALKLVDRVFDFDGDGKLSTEEASRARVVVFGQSLGGRAALTFARAMKERGVGIELVVVVDAIGRDDYVVPDNVRQAANVFQRDHLVLKGAAEIRAADPGRTKILFNRRVSYRGSEIDIGDEPLKHRLFMGAHIRLEYDLPLWKEIENLLAAATATARARD